ncbi:MAG: transglycosylase domain-containing protein, partial [Bacilli bacterium]
MSRTSPTDQGPLSRRLNRRRKQRMRRRRAALALGLSAAGVAVGCVLGVGAYLLRDTPTLRLSDFVDLPAASLVYAGDGALIGRFAGHGDRRPLHSLRAAGKNIPLAFIAAEDKDFYRHPGIDPAAIVRSALDDIRHRAIRSGGSTITQQTVKLAMFPRQERTLRRKLQEMALALELEQQQSKDQILLEYLNAIYFGRTDGVPVYGVESAAQHIFGRCAQDVTAAQAALLAAIPNNPSLFSLRFHPDQVRQRQLRILSKMRELKFLSVREYATAASAPILSEVRHDAVLTAPYESKTPFVLAQVSRLAPQMIAESERIPLEQAREQLESGGCRIYTSIDRELQARVADVLHSSGFPPPITYTVHGRSGAHVVRRAEEEAGLVLLQNRSARILALAGGRDYARNLVDHTVARRQAGSSLKPLVVYGPALEQGLITPGSIVDDMFRE